MIFLNKKNYLRKSVALVLLAVVLTFSPIQARKADALWGEIPAQIFGEAMDQLQAKIMGVIMGALKQSAAKMINEQVANLVGGSSSGNSKIIGDYRDFLYAEPREKAQTFMNDHLSQITAGKSSLSGYRPNPGFGSNSGGTLSSQLVDMAKQSLMGEIEFQVDYVGDPRENLFANGSMENFNKYLSGINNPWSFQLYAEHKFKERLEIETDAARTEAIAGQGFKGTRVGGSIVTPGSLIGANAANVMDIGNKIIADAKSIPETITATVSQVISQAIENGVGKAAENIQREGKQSNWNNPDQASESSPDWSTPSDASSVGNLP